MSRTIGSAGQSADDVARRQREKAQALLRRAENFKRGAAGERAVSEALSALPDGFTVLHDLDIPGSRANLDHVVIGPSGVTVVDAKAYSGRLTAGSGTMWKGRYPIRKECATVSWEADQLASHLGVPVSAALCFVGTGLPAPVTALSDAIVCSPEGLLRHLKSAPRTLGPQEIEALVLRAAQLLRSGPISTSAASAPTASTPNQPSPADRVRPPAQRNGVGSPLIRLLIGAAAVIGFTALIPAMTRLLSKATEAAIPLPESHERSASAAPPTTPSAAQTAPVSTEGSVGAVPAGGALADVPGTTVVVDAPPTLKVECDGTRHEWTAKFIATQFVTDEQGYDTWYRVGGEQHPWIYAGRFLSGVYGPSGVGGIGSSTTVELRYDRRGMVIDPETTTGYESFTTGPSC